MRLEMRLTGCRATVGQRWIQGPDLLFPRRLRWSKAIHTTALARACSVVTCCDELPNMLRQPGAS